MIDVREYVDLRGLIRLTGGNVSNVKGVGSGVFEYKIDFGYRIYFGKDGAAW